MTFCVLHCIDCYLLLPRQCYKTHSTIALLEWAYLFGTTNSQFNFLNKQQTDADANLAKFKLHKSVLPIWLQQNYNFIDDGDGERKIKKGMDNVRTIKNPVTGNWIESKPSARTPEAADGIGRGNTSAFIWIDEYEFVSYIGQIMAASGPAYVRAAEIANKNNALHCRIITTTPGNIDSEPVESSQPSRDNAARFTEKFYDMNYDELHEYMERNSKNGICYIEFNYRQIGMDENYFHSMVKVLEGNKTKIKREVLLQRIRGANDSPFDEEDLDAINDNRKEPIDERMVRKYYILDIYEEIDKDISYIVSVDPSTGVGQNSDNTAINIIDPYSLRSIATLVTPYADPVESSKIIVELVTKYTPKCMLVIERNSLGCAVIAIIARTAIAANLYYDSTKVLENTGEDKLNRKGYLDASPENRRYWGISTVNKNREIMTHELLGDAVKNHHERFIARELIDDLNNLYMKSSGRIEARPGTHDDVVMSYLIGIYAYTYGKNIHHWGIIKGMSRPKKQENQKETLTYEQIYADLPENLKAIFPAPNGNTIDLTNRIAGTANGVVQSSDHPDQTRAKNNEIYRQIQAIQAKRTRQIIQSDGTKVTVKNNVTTNDMVDDAVHDENNFNTDVFDIIDIINK